MASLQMVKAIQPLSDVVDSMHSWLLRAGSLLERVEVALGRLSPSTAEASHTPMLSPLPKLVVDFEGDKDVDLYGCFSPRASGFSPRVGSSSTPQVLPDFEGVASVEVVSPVLQIMPELRELCLSSASLLSVKHMKVESLVTSCEGDDSCMSCEHPEASSESFGSEVHVVEDIDVACVFANGKASVVS